MITEEKFRELKREYEEQKAAAERAKGAYDQLMERLRTEFECESLEAAQKKLRKLKVSVETAETEFNTALAAYEKKWSPE